ncbi:uncharacterized protein BJX67DRAFT_391634 [Aspergillus lucknowensis]|uniref:FluG domain protein n=1 Tax=Aspergillus lucknowensis TaxID=176173 RepID=A0ABR4L9C8_9EURO
MMPPPVPPAQPGEHQFWTDPILCEETRARLEHFRSLGWLPPNFKPKTLEGLAVLNKDYVKYLLLEDQAIYMNFFDWMYKTSRKKLLQSYNEYWRRLCQYFCLFARRRVNGNFHEQMRRFLEHVLPAERKISRRTKNKNTLDVDVFYHFRYGSMIIQFATIQLWSAITGTRPGMLLPQNASLADSDLPKHVLVDDLPASVCYRDIKLFILKDPDNKRDVLCEIIEFCNLKGRPEGADGTKFFMHGDYQLAYCPINQIISLAFRDGAFLNAALTLELIWQLQVPKRSPSLPLRWKPEKLDTPLLRCLERTLYGYELHKSLPMTYDSSRQALKELGQGARFGDDINHYNYCRWTANEVNRNFTSQERQRVLGQSGDAVFEKHYQSQFINRDLQHVVLLRPPQEGLLQAAGSMLRKRDPLAPSGLTNAQKHTICQHPKVLALRQEKRELIHEAIKKKLSQLRKTLANNTQETARKEYFHTAPVLEVDRQIKQLLGQSDFGQSDADSSEDEDWELPTPNYNFYGLEAENFNEDKLLARRIQVTKEMESLKCPTDVCIICCGQSQLLLSNPPPHKFSDKRQDSVHRHLIDSHLAHAHDGISCTWPSCHGIPEFTKLTEFLAHAVTVHAYDINIKLHHLPRQPRLTCSDTSSVDSAVESVESDGRSGTDTPASSVNPETANIDPRLLESHKPKVTKPLLRRSKRLRP